MSKQHTPEWKEALIRESMTGDVNIQARKVLPRAGGGSAVMTRLLAAMGAVVPRQGCLLRCRLVSTSQCGSRHTPLLSLPCHPQRQSHLYKSTGAIVGAYLRIDIPKLPRFDQYNYVLFTGAHWAAGQPLCVAQFALGCRVAVM